MVDRTKTTRATLVRVGKLALHLILKPFAGDLNVVEAKFAVDAVDLRHEVCLGLVVHGPLHDAHLDLEVTLERTFGDVARHIDVGVRRGITLVRALDAAIQAASKLEHVAVEYTPDCEIVHDHSLILCHHKLVE
jgi:hypothetical protein